MTVHKAYATIELANEDFERCFKIANDAMTLEEAREYAKNNDEEIIDEDKGGLRKVEFTDLGDGDVLTVEIEVIDFEHKRKRKKRT